MKEISLIITLFDMELLLFRRNVPSSKYYGRYGLAGGMVENNESPLQCIQREIKEETNLNVYPIRFVKSYNWRGRKIHLFYGRVKTIRNMVLNDEHSDYGFFAPDELNDKCVIETVSKFYNDLPFRL